MELFISIVITVLVFSVVYDKLIKSMINKKIKCLMELDSQEGHEKDTFTLVVTVTNNSILPISTIRTEVHLPDGLEFVTDFGADADEHGRYICSPLPDSKKTISTKWSVKATKRGEYIFDHITIIRQFPFGRKKEQIDLSLSNPQKISIHPYLIDLGNWFSDSETSINKTILKNSSETTVILNMQSRSREQNFYNIAHLEAVDMCVNSASSFLEELKRLNISTSLLSNGLYENIDNEYKVHTRNGYLTYIPHKNDDELFNASQYLMKTKNEITTETYEMLRMISKNSENFNLSQSIIIITAYLDSFFLDFYNEMISRGKKVVFCIVSPQSEIPVFPLEAPVFYLENR